MRKTEFTAAEQRRLAAILSADVEGYTRLMNSDEGGTLRLLGSHRAITDRLIPRHGGRIANTAGDSILAEFPSAVEALRCAIAVQERITATNLEVPEARRVRFRIGLHVGEVVVKDGDLLGDGVNVAARLQSLAEPDSVCLSETALQFVQRQLPLTYDDLGPQRVKNLDTPIRAYLVRASDPRTLPAIPAVHRRQEAHLARRFHALCHAAMSDVTKRARLTPVEFAGLASVHDAPGIEPRGLRQRLGLDEKSALGVVDRLLRLGLIASVAGNGRTRTRRLQATRRGSALLEKLRPAIGLAQNRVMAPLSDRERQTLQDLLLRVINAAERSDKAGGNP